MNNAKKKNTAFGVRIKEGIQTVSSTNASVSGAHSMRPSSEQKKLASEKDQWSRQNRR